MQKYSILILLILIGYSVQAQSLTKKVLFIGNSYTQVNNLPQIIADAASSVGDVLIYDSNLPGGYTLLQHSTNAVTQSKIMMGTWDHVVLQGQSQEPLTGENNFYRGATDLNLLISQSNPCTVPILYVTWGRKNGDSANCPNVPSMCSYEAMDTALKASYLGLATHLQTEASPVSVVWKYLRQNYPTMELYQSDESHPSAAGSYAAACCFYAIIFKKDPTLISYNSNLSADTALIIRNAAKACVFDSLSSWNFKQMPIANFNYKIGEAINEVSFENNMLNSDNCSWDFSDGSPVSTALNPTHSYAADGTYTVTLTTSNCDLQGVHQDVFEKTLSFCSHTPTISPAGLMLCPQSSEMLSTQLADSYQWFQHGTPIPGAVNQFFEVSTSSDNSLLSVMTTINGCSEMSRQSSIGQHGWMFGFLTIGMTLEGNVFDSNKVCNDETISLHAEVFDEHLAQWYRNNVPIPFATGDDLIVTESGTYKVKIDHPACPGMGEFFELFMDNLMQYEFVDCSLGNDDTSQTFLLSPNPVKNILTVQTRRAIKEILVYDILGKRIEVKPFGDATIGVSFLPKGLYIVVATTIDHVNYSGKFIKE